MPGKKILIDHKQISIRIQQIGEQITHDYVESNLLLIGVLNGAFVFTADLARSISLPLEVEFIKVASYGNKTSSSGNIKLDKDIDMPLEGCDIIVVEDIVDTGNTISWLKEHLARKKPRSIKFCTFIDKIERREHKLDIDYSGFKISEGFLVGYGLDYNGLYRNLPDVYELMDT